MSDEAVSNLEKLMTGSGVVRDGDTIYVPSGRLHSVKVPAALISQVTRSIIAVIFAVAFCHIAVLLFPDTLDVRRQERQQQTLQQLQQLMQRPSAGPSKESAPDSGQPDYRLKRNSYTRGPCASICQLASSARKRCDVMPISFARKRSRWYPPGTTLTRRRQMDSADWMTSAAPGWQCWTCSS